MHTVPKKERVSQRKIDLMNTAFKEPIMKILFSVFAITLSFSSFAQDSSLQPILEPKLTVDSLNLVLDDSKISCDHDSATKLVRTLLNRIILNFEESNYGQSSAYYNSDDNSVIVKRNEGVYYSGLDSRTMVFIGKFKLSDDQKTVMRVETSFGKLRRKLTNEGTIVSPRPRYIDVFDVHSINVNNCKVIKNI